MSTAPKKTCFVIIEFYPSGVFPFFGIPMSELTNRLLPVDSLSKTWNHDGIRGRVNLIQERLLQSLQQGQSPNRTVDYCVDFLRRANGRASISDLAHKTGYNKRSMEILFKKYVGVPPKTLAGIFRFQWFYKKYASGQSYKALKEEMYEYFYDQAHFTKDFKKMAGYSLRYLLLNVPNEFGRKLTIQ